MAEAGTAKDPLIEKLNELQQLIEHVPSHSTQLALLKEQVAFYLGNGKPGEFQSLKLTVTEQSRQLLMMKGALIVLLSELSVIAPILVSRWLEAHK